MRFVRTILVLIVIVVAGVFIYNYWSGNGWTLSPPAGSTGINLTLLLRAITKVLGWRLRGRAWPNPFFHLKTRQPIYPLQVLSSEERDELRPLCGPHPAARPISAAP